MQCAAQQQWRIPGVPHNWNAITGRGVQPPGQTRSPLHTTTAHGQARLPLTNARISSIARVNRVTVLLRCASLRPIPPVAPTQSLACRNHQPPCLACCPLRAVLSSFRVSLAMFKNTFQPGFLSILYSSGSAVSPHLSSAQLIPACSPHDCSLAGSSRTHQARSDRAGRVGGVQARTSVRVALTAASRGCAVSGVSRCRFGTSRVRHQHSQDRNSS